MPKMHENDVPWERNFFKHRHAVKIAEMRENAQTHAPKKLLDLRRGPISVILPIFMAISITVFAL